MRGLEPPRRWHWFLRPARLPVPPHPHFLMTKYILAQKKNDVNTNLKNKTQNYIMLTTSCKIVSHMI